MKHFICAFAVVSVSACAGANDEKIFQEECTETLGKRLKAPATLVIGNVDFYKTTYADESDLSRLEGTLRGHNRLDKNKLSDADRIGYDLKASRLESSIKSLKEGETLTRYSLYMEYDAANGFGTPIRSKAHCTYDATTETIGYSTYLNVKIDGKTHNDWFFDSLGR